MKKILALTASLSFTACSTVSTVANGFDAHPITKDSVTSVDVTQMIADAAGIEKTRDTTLVGATLAFNNNLDAETKKERRNTIVGALAMASDQNCSVYIKRIQNYQMTSSSVAGIFETLVDGAGAVTTDALTSRILSGASSVTSGIVTTFDSAAFASESARVLIRQITADRQVIRQGLSVRMKEDYENWPMSEALGDALGYHSYCSIMAGLNGLERAAQEGDIRLESVIAAAGAAAEEAERAYYAGGGANGLERSFDEDAPPPPDFSKIIEDAIAKERASGIR